MEMRYTQASMQARLATSDGRLDERRAIKRLEAENARIQCDYETRVNTEIESQLRDSLDVSARPMYECGGETDRSLTRPRIG